MQPKAIIPKHVHEQDYTIYPLTDLDVKRVYHKGDKVTKTVHIQVKKGRALRGEEDPGGHPHLDPQRDQPSHGVREDVQPIVREEVRRCCRAINLADWDCIFRKLGAREDGRVKPGHDGVCGAAT